MAGNAPFPMPVTQDWVEKTGREWQERLRLTNWVMLFRVVTAEQMGEENRWGYNNYFLNQKVSHISILDKVDKVTHLGYDPEATLVHEILHCHLLQLKVKNTMADEEEFAIEALSQALVGAKRGARTAAVYPGVFHFEE